MEALALHWVAQSIGARLLGPRDVTVRGVCTDTRKGAAGAVFFALRGDRADGHDYVARAFEEGAVAAVVEREVGGATGAVLLVPDALVALGDLAGAYRRRFEVPVVGITGSVGKTSTREMVTCALRSRLSVHANEHNYNNEIGVPLTLLALDGNHQAVVLEMAMRGPGQISRLASIAGPTVGVVTNIGLSHVELLGSRAAIAAAKAELLEALPDDGTAVLNADDEYAGLLRERAPGAVVTYSIERPADFRATDVTFDAAGEPTFRLNGQSVHIPAPGVHHVLNAAAACAVSSVLGIGLREVSESLEGFKPPAMRMQILQARDGVTVLNDAYNAAPDSMRAAIETLALLSSGRRRTVAVLGEMKELGAHAPEAHRYVGEVAARLRTGLVITVGPAAEETARAAATGLGAERVRTYADTGEAARAVPPLLLPGDIVLVKGSRAMEMERIVEALMAEPPTVSPSEVAGPAQEMR